MRNVSLHLFRCGLLLLFVCDCQNVQLVFVRDFEMLVPLRMIRFKIDFDWTAEKCFDHCF